MRDELLRLYLLLLATIFMFFILLKRIYLEEQDPNFWHLYFEKMVESMRLGGFYL